MKTSPLNNNVSSGRHRTQSGFTLIEMMVVLVIIGIIVSSVVLSVRTDDLEEHMEIEMQRIQALLNLAREEAVLQGEEMALTIRENKYSFEVLGEKGWQPITDDKVFRERSIVVGTELALKVDNLEIDFGKTEEKAEKEFGQDKVPPPRIFILSSGEIMPFELILRTLDQSVQYSLKAELDGVIKLITPAENLG